MKQREKTSAKFEKIELLYVPEDIIDSNILENTYDKTQPEK